MNLSYSISCEKRINVKIHGDTELSNMESFNLKETKNGDNRN